MKNDGYNSGSLFLSFLLGGAVGAGLALLLAPQSGRETRQKIREAAEGVKDLTTGYIDDAKKRVNSFVDDGKGYYEQKKSILKSAIDAGKEAYEREKERLSQEQNA